MPKDSNLVVRTGSAVFVSSVPEVVSLDLDGTALHGLALQIRIPSAAGGVPALKVEIHAASASVATTAGNIIAARTGMVKGAEYIVPFSTPLRSVAFAFAATTSTTAAFSKISADVIENVGHDWTRLSAEWR